MFQANFHALLRELHLFFYGARSKLLYLLKHVFSQKLNLNCLLYQIRLLEHLRTCNRITSYNVCYTKLLRGDEVVVFTLSKEGPCTVYSSDLKSEAGELAFENIPIVRNNFV